MISRYSAISCLGQLYPPLEGSLTSSAQRDDSPTAQFPEDLQATIRIAARPDGPLQLGDFEIDDEGRLRPRADGRPIAFGFSYRGLDFMAEVGTGGEAQIQLSAELGKLPYRAAAGEGRDLTRRVVEATANLPSGQIDISAEHDMRLQAQTAAPSPLTPASLMAALAAMLLEFKPYIELLHEVMLAPRPESRP